MDKTELRDQMKVLLASVFAFYLKAHSYHWNVTGPNFAQYHDFFGDVYSDLHMSVDKYAELIRTLRSFSPGSLSRFSELSRVSDDVSVPSAKFMFIRLAVDNELVLDQLSVVARIASTLEERGILAYIEGQMDFHRKLQWKLEAFEEA